MELVELYNKAIGLVEDVKKFSPQFVADDDFSLCVVVNADNEVYAGVTGVRISNGTVMKACSEYNAIMSMIADGHITAKQMMTVSFADGSICCPCRECIDMLYKADENNTQCEIAVSLESTVKACELRNEEVSVSAETVPDIPETAHAPIEEIPEFSEEPVSDSFSFEEKFGFDFDDTPAEPVPTLADQNQEVKNVQPEQTVNPYTEQYQNTSQQGMNPQFVQPNNMQGYSQSQGYPYPPQGYPQGYPYPPQGYPQGYPYPQQGYLQGYPQQNGMNPQFVQPDVQQGYSQQYTYGQQPNQPVNQGNFPYNAQPYPQNQGSSQPLQSVSPHQPAPYISSRYINSSMGSSSQPVGSVPLSGEGKSKFRQRLNKFISEDAPVAPSAPVKPAEETLSKDEIKKMARDKKKMAKVNADFKKRMKDLGY